MLFTNCICVKIGLCVKESLIISKVKKNTQVFMKENHRQITRAIFSIIESVCKMMRVYINNKVYSFQYRIQF